MYTSNKNNKNPFFVIERDEDADPEPIKDIVRTQVQSNLTHLISPFTQLLIEGGKKSAQWIIATMTNQVNQKFIILKPSMSVSSRQYSNNNQNEQIQGAAELSPSHR